MAIYRNISTNFWRDTKVMDLFSPEDKYFMLYCLTNTYTNLSGCYEVSIKQMSRDTGYNEETIQNLLHRLDEKFDIIKYDFNTNELFIKNWHKFNWTSSQKLDKPLLNEIKAIKSPIFKEILANLYNKRDTVSIPYTYPTDTTVSVTVSVTDTVTDTDTVSGTVFNLFINKINNKKQELEKEHNKFTAYTMLTNWIKKQPEYIKLTEEERRKVINEAWQKMR